MHKDDRDYEVEVHVEPRAPKLGDMPDWAAPVLRVAEWLDRQISPKMWFLIGLVAAGYFIGTPHMLVTYRCSGSCTPQRAYLCDYIGVTGWKPGLRADREKGCAYLRIL